MQTNLTGALADRLERSVDLLIFNPPYVPTVDEEVGKFYFPFNILIHFSIIQIRPGLPAAWAGGLFGRKIIDKFLADCLSRTLSDTGLAYLVVIEPNNLQQLCEAATELGFAVTLDFSRRCGIEKLSVLRFRRL